MTVIDVLIVGGGPAGIAAAIEAHRMGLDTLLLESVRPGGSLWERYTIEDYPGFPMGITGYRLAGLFVTQAHQKNIRMSRCTVKHVRRRGSIWEVESDRGTFTSKAVIVCTGTSPIGLGIPGEEQLLGRRIFYSTHAPAADFEGKQVIIIGASEHALDQALLIGNKAREVKIVCNTNMLNAPTEIIKRLEQNAIPIVKELEVVSFSDNGNGLVISFRDGTGNTLERTADVAFVFGLRRPNTEVLPIEVRNNMSTNINGRTILPGLYVAGDIRRGTLASVASAVGDGVSAARALFEELGGRNGE